MTENSLGFDANKFFLGSLCRKNHQWSKAGQTLRRKSDGHCLECSKLGDVARRASKECKSKLWQECEDKILTANYDAMTFEEIAKLIPGRDAKSVGKRARSLGLKRDNSWKDWENEILKQHYSSSRGVAKKIHEEWLTHRTVGAIHAQAGRLGLVDEQAWTPEEDQILYDFYAVCSHKELETLVSGRTKVAVVARATKLGLSRSKDWTEEEIALLQEYYNPNNVNLAAELIPTRTRRMIIQKARQIGLSNKRVPWELWEDEIIRKNYEAIGGLEIKNQFLPHRTVLSIRGRANSFGLYTRWSEEEIKIVSQYYHKLDWDTLLTMLPFRTKAAIEGKAAQIGVTKPPGEAWQEWEIDLLKEEYPKRGASQIQVLLPHRTTTAVIAKAFDLGLCKPTVEIRWTKEEKAILRQNYGKLTYAELHELLPARAPRSICAMARSMGIAKSSDKEMRPWTNEEDEVLRMYYKDFGSKYVASLLKSRTNSSILSRANKLGLKIRQAWTPEEDAVIRANYENGCNKISHLLPYRTIIAIKQRAFQIGFKTEINRWTTQEDKILRENYRKLPFMQLCLLLPERTRGSIMKRVSILNLQEQGFPKWTPKEDEIILNNYLHLNAKDLKALLPNRGVSAIYNRVQKLGLQKAFSGFVPRFYTRHSIHYNRYTTEELKSRFDQFNDRCPYCYSTIDFDMRASFEWDHFIPVSRGGSDVIGNLIPCCPTCNIKKSNHDPYEWFIRQAFFSPKRWRHILRVLGKTNETYQQIPLI